MTDLSKVRAAIWHCDDLEKLREVARASADALEAAFEETDWEPSCDQDCCHAFNALDAALKRLEAPDGK